jgi:hypothetical protein
METPSILGHGLVRLRNEAKISDRQMQILRHALGLDNSRLERRNHYAPAAQEEGDCADLETKGLMVHFTRSWLPGPIYQCTNAGKAVAESW